MKWPEELQQAQEITLPEGSVFFHQGDACLQYVIVTAGVVKVFARSASGREMVLYRVKEGDMCVLTTSCLLGNQHYPAEAIVEKTVKAKIIGRDAFKTFLDQSPTFREFVFSRMSARLSDLISVIEQITLEGIDARLSNYLLEQGKAGVIEATHQDIAMEIGSAREVVSRHLKALEKQGVVQLERGRVKILQAQRLSLSA